MYSRGCIPKDSLKPNDIMMSTLHLFTKPHSDQPISDQSPGQPISDQSSVQATPPMDCINHGTHCVSLILTLTSRKTTSTALNHSLHLRVSNKMLSTTCGSLYVIICSIQGKFVRHLPLCKLTHRYCVASTCNNFPACSFRWPHLTLIAYF